MVLNRRDQILYINRHLKYTKKKLETTLLLQFIISSPNGFTLMRLSAHFHSATYIGLEGVLNMKSLKRKI